MSPLDYTWQIYSNLHQQALLNKTEVLKWRKIFMLLTITAALLGSLAGYLQTFHLCIPVLVMDIFNLNHPGFEPCYYTTILAKKIGMGLGVISTILVSAIAYYGSKLMLSDKEQLWTKARSLSEALKSKIYLFCTSKGEFAGQSDPDKVELLLNRAEEYLRQANEIILEKTVLEPNMPKVSLTIEEYIHSRFSYQKDTYYRSQALLFKSTIKKYDRITLALGFLSIVFSALVTFYDASVLIAMITSITTAIGSYYSAMKLKEQMNQFNATANQLDILYQRFLFSKRIDENDFVVQSENIINAENSAWMSMWVE
jgi:SMODS and SLOG-associating 2TM effector domain 1/Protein of unknown function (DUF4231)